MKIISIQKESVIPIYKQIVKSIETTISGKKLAKNDRLPSINKVCLENEISRDTVLVAYEELKKRGVIYAIPGKGYFVKSEQFAFEQRYFLLFDELNSFKEDLYNSFISKLDSSIHVDIFFHHFNRNLFKKLVLDSNGDYSKYILMPSNLKQLKDIIKVLPEEDVYILDQTNEQLINYPGVYQNFIGSMFSSLEKGLERLKKYNKLVLIFPGDKEPLGMISGFEQFCVNYQFINEIVADVSKIKLEKGQVFIVPNDRQLVEIIEKAKEQDLIIGDDIGLISYNDTPLKKVVENGITTISTDFKLMGETLADMVLNNKNLLIENPSNLIMRSSL